jgi:hypothetical protein
MPGTPPEPRLPPGVAPYSADELGRALSAMGRDPATGARMDGAVEPPMEPPHW